MKNLHELYDLFIDDLQLDDTVQGTDVCAERGRDKGFDSIENAKITIVLLFWGRILKKV